MTTLLLLASLGAAIQPNPVLWKAPGAESLQGTETRKHNDIVIAQRMPSHAEYEWPTELITQAEGASSLWAKEGEALAVVDFNVQQSLYTDYISELVEQGDGTVYMRNPISHYVTHSYIKGKRDGDKLTFPLPQLISCRETPQGESNVYIMKLNFEVTEEGQKTYIPDFDETEISFTLYGDRWVMDSSDLEEWVLGACNDNAQWIGYGDCNTEMALFEEQPTKAPEGLSLEPYSLTYTYRIETGHQVYVGYDGDKAWIKGLAYEMPDAWVCGRVEGDSISFDCFQYMGIEPESERLAYFAGGEFVTNDQGETGYLIGETAKFGFDPESGEIDYSGKYIIINHSRSTFDPLCIMESAIFSQYPEGMPLIPQTPTVYFVADYDQTTGTAGFMGFGQPNITTDGLAMNPDELYYRIFIDGEPYTFNPDLYKDLDEPTTEIPALANNIYGSFQGNGIFGNREMIIRFYGFDSIGVQSVYHNCSDVTYSDICVYDLSTGMTDIISGVEELSADSEIVGEEWYTLSGLRIDNPDKGIYIKAIHFSDGTVKTIKVAK